MNTTTHENLVILFTYLVLVLCDVFMYGLRRLSRVEVHTSMHNIESVHFSSREFYPQIVLWLKSVNYYNTAGLENDLFPRFRHNEDLGCYFRIY